MGRTLLTMLLMAAVTQAQVGVLPVSLPQPTRMDPTRMPRWIHVVPQYQELRRESDEKVLLAVTLNPTSLSATTYWGAPSPKSGPFGPTELKIEVTEGLTATAFEYSGFKTVAVASSEKPVHVIGPNFIDMHFKLHASRTVPLGDHLLKGKLRFQRIGKVGVSVPQELEFSIPIRVVEHNAKVAKDRSYRQNLTPLQITGMVLLIPVMVPLILLAAATGWDGC
jgi:hypothetical protein